MIKLLLFLLLCSLGYQLVRSIRRAPPTTDRRDEGRRIDPSRAVDAQFEDIDDAS
ncbi:MAG: hypothetical protein VCE12_02815 [Candidatus Latescibacterota bacterium]